MSERINLSFKPKEIIKRLLSVLTKRGQDILISRYGLGSKTAKFTLDAIGKRYGITRERVRQIENHSLFIIRKSKVYKDLEPVFAELKKVILDLGGIISEKDLLKHLSKDPNVQNCFYFLLIIGEEFKREKADEEFKHHWHVDRELAEKIKSALRKLYSSLSDDELVAEGDLVSSFLEEVKDLNEKYKNEEVIKRWFSISNKIDKNPLGEWGRASSSNVNAKGMRDYAFLVIRKHGSPIHFKEVAKAITQYFNKKAHVATTHNELIKDPRFVLVCRGMYALSEWGYKSGTVKDVLVDLLKNSSKPMPKTALLAKVMNARIVKENTILLNLQDAKTFVKNNDGTYELKEA